jgi:type 1 fimbria pilin
MIKRTVVGLIVAAALCVALWGPSARAADEAPDGVLEFNGGSAAAGVGVSWGAGVLKYQDRSYPFKVNGLSIGAVGLSQASASGEVFNLKKLDDFNGNYVAVGAGLTVAGGGAAAAMKNQNGVTIHVKGTTQGAKVVVGGSGVDVQLLK